MSGNRDVNGGIKALSNILSVWNEDAVNFDDNGGWSCDF